ELRSGRFSQCAAGGHGAGPALRGLRLPERPARDDARWPGRPAGAGRRPCATGRGPAARDERPGGAARTGGAGGRVGAPPLRATRRAGRMGRAVRRGAEQTMSGPAILRVIHVITGLGQGGAESVLFRLATYPDQRVRHSVVSLTDEGVYGARLRTAGVPVHALGMPRGRLTLDGFLALRRLLASERPDAVQTWMYHADLIGGLAARLAGIRAVAWGIRNSGAHLRRSSRSARLVLKLCALLSGRVPATIICAARDAAVRHEQYGYRADRLEVIANGYDLSRYQPDESARERMRQVWQVAPQTPLIGCVARWDPLKDHANLLAAVAALVRDGRDRGLQCVLVGRGMSPGNAELAALIDRHDLRG